MTYQTAYSTAADRSAMPSQEASRSTEDWLTSLLTPNAIASADFNNRFEANRSQNEVRDALASLRKMMQAQSRQSNELNKQETVTGSPLVESLETLKHEMALIAAAINNGSLGHVNGQNAPVHQGFNPQTAQQRRFDPDSILADIELRQTEIMNGLKRPSAERNIASQTQSQPQVQPPSRSFIQPTQNMREDLTALGATLAEILPQKTIAAMREELNHAASQAGQIPNEKLQTIQNDIRSLSLKLDHYATKEAPVVDLTQIYEALSQLNRQSPDVQQALPAIRESIAQLASSLDIFVKRQPSQATIGPELTANIDRKFDEIYSALSQTVRESAQTVRDSAQTVRESAQRSNSTPQSNEVERAFAILLQKIDATDRKIEQLMFKEQIHAPNHSRVIQPTPAPIPVQIIEEPAATPTPAPAKAVDRLTERFRPAAPPQASSNEASIASAVIQAAPPPAAPVTETITIAPNRNFSKPIETGSLPFDLPLEPGSGSPRGRASLPKNMSLLSDMPSATINYEVPKVESKAIPGTSNKALETLLAHKKKILLGLAALLMLIGGIKAVDMLASPPAKKSFSQSQSQKPAKKIELAAPQKVEQDIPPLFAPNGVDKITTAGAKVAPVVHPPGVVLNQGWQSSDNQPEKPGRDPLAGLKSAADRGNPSAQFELANRLFDGQGITKNQTEALLLYQKAADQNFAPAQFRLGSLLEKGVGSPKDSEKARKLYLSAAGLGHAKSMHNLAVLSADNSEGKADLRSASQWFKRAADHGVTDSQYNLAVLYARGLGVEQSFIESYKWFALAALGGDGDAANKRDDMAKKLSSENLAAVKNAVETFVPKKEPEQAIKIDLPPEALSASTGFTPRIITGKKN